MPSQRELGDRLETLQRQLQGKIEMRKEQEQWLTSIEEELYLADVVQKPRLSKAREERQKNLGEIQSGINELYKKIEEIEIQLKPVNPQEEQVSLHSVFISYRRADSADITGRIYDKLVESFSQERIFKDVDAIPAGQDFRDVIDKAVSNCQVVLAIIGTDWLNITESDGTRRLDNPRDLVRIELEAALSRQIPVIPVLVKGTKMPKANELAIAIRDLAYRNALPVRPDPDFHRDLDKLIEAITGYIGG